MLFESYHQNTHTDKHTHTHSRQTALPIHYSLLPLLLLLLHPFNGRFSRTTWVSQHQKGKPFWILLEQEMMGVALWRWHQLDHMQIICTSLQTDNHASISPFSFLQARCPSCHPTNSVKALKAQPSTSMEQKIRMSFLPQ